MKANTTKQYLYRADYYGYTIVSSADGTISTKVYTQDPVEVSLSLSVNLLGDLIIESESKMQLDGRIATIVDVNDDEIYTDGEWQIFQTAPILGPMGTKAGYRYRARIIAGNI